MTMDELLDSFYDVKIKAANVQREIDDMNNIIDSVTDRLNELDRMPESYRKTQEWKDSYVRARDKRRLTRDQISERLQQLRHLEASAEATRLTIEFGAIEGG